MDKVNIVEVREVAELLGADPNEIIQHMIDADERRRLYE